MSRVLAALAAALFIVVFGLGGSSVAPAPTQARINLPGGEAQTDGNIASI